MSSDIPAEIRKRFVGYTDAQIVHRVNEIARINDVPTLANTLKPGQMKRLLELMPVLMVHPDVYSKEKAV